MAKLFDIKNRGFDNLEMYIIPLNPHKMVTF